MACADGTRRRRAEGGSAVRFDWSAIPVADGRHVDHDSVEAGDRGWWRNEPLRFSGISKCETKLML